MRKIYLLFLVLLLSMLRVNAQSSLYGFSVENGTYVPLTGGVVFQTSSGDPIASVDADPGQDSKASVAVTIPAFQFAGVSYTNIRVTSNGQLVFGTTGTLPSSTYTSISSTFADNKVLAPFGADLNVGASGVSDIRFQVVGDESVVEWRNFRRFGKTESFSFQIRMNNVSGVIKFMYNGSPPFDPTTNYQPQIGIKNSANDYQYLILGPGDSWVNAITSITGVSSTSVCKFYGTTGFVNGLTYVFTPPVPCSGTPNGGVVSIARQNLCSGATPVAISVGYVNSGFSGISYKWQESTDNVNWADVAGATAGTSLNYTPPAYNGTTKYYRLKTTCANGAGVAYSTVSEVTGGATPLSVTSLVFSGVSDYNMTIGWTNGGGNRRMVMISDTNNFIDPIDGNGPELTATNVYAGTGQQIVYDGTGNSVTVTLLSCSETYYVRVYEYLRCGTTAPFSYWYALPTSGSQVTNATSLSTVVENMPEAITLTGFTGSNLSTVSPGWNERSGDGPFTANASSWTNNTVNGVPTARINLLNTSRKEWIISPPVNINVAARVIFKAAMTASTSSNPASNGGMVNTDDKIQVMISTDACGEVWTPLYTIDASNAAQFGTTLVPQEVLIPSSYIGENVRIGFKAVDGPVDDTNDYYFHLADIVIEAVPLCSDVLGVGVTNITKNSVTVSWTASNPIPSVGYEYEIRTSGLPGEPGAIQTGAVPAGVNFKDIVGLLPFTEYFVYVRTNCLSGQNGAWSEVHSFKTLCDYPELTSAPPVTRCGVGTVELSATFDSGTVEWFTTQTGGTKIGTGNALTSPTISTTTSFWAQSSVVGGVSSSGLPAPLSNGTYNDTDTGIVFSVLESVQLQSVSVYSLGAGTINIQIVNSSGVQLYETGTVNIVAGGITTPNVVPLDYTIAPGTGYRMLIKAYSASVNLVRDSSIGGFPYNGTDGLLNVTNGYISGTGTSYYYFYDIRYIGKCISPRTEVIATVTPAPALTLSSNSLEICEGQSTLVTLTAGATDYDSFIWSPIEGVTGNQTTGWTFDPVVSTVYTLTSTQSAGSECANIVTLNVAVNPLPIFTPLAEEYDVCVGSVQELDINNISKFVIGTGTTTTTTSDVSTAFMNRWSQSKQQYIYTKDELNAIGIYSGEISYLAFQISSLGSAGTNNNYTIKMKSVTQSSFATTTFITDGFTTVFGPVNYTHTATGWQVFNFTTPFNWDGNSNILIELTQLGANSTNNAETFYTLTTDNKGLGVQGGSALTDISGGFITKRLNAKFRPDVLATVTWSPQTNLFLDQAATQAYTGSSVSKVYFKSDQDASIAYTVNIVTDEGCAESTLTTVNVTSVAVPIVNEQTFCNEVEVSDIVVTGLTTGGTLKWFDSITSTTEITSVATSGTYYLVQELDGCSSVRVAAEIEINGVNDAPVAVAEQNFCGVTTVGDLVATALAGNTIGWFSSETSTIELVATTELTSGIYYVSQYNGQCWSPRASVTVSVAPVPATPVSVSQIFCGTPTLSEVDLGQDDNATLKWYASETATSDLPLTTQIVTTTYYVSQTIFGCESARVAVSMTVQDVLPAPVAPLTQLYCGTVSIAGLDATATAGGTISWFDTETSEIPLPTGQNVVTGIYYVAQFNGACWSEKTTIQVTVNSVPAAPSNADVQLCGNYTFSQVSIGQVSGATLKWYETATSITPLSPSTNVVQGTYYVSQSLGGCESPRVMINISQTDALNNPTAVSQTFCGSATVADLVAQGTAGASIVWFNSSVALNPLSPNASLVTGTYYAAQTKNGCFSSRVPISVFVVSVAAPNVDAFNFCGSATVSDLVLPTPTGVVYKWFNSPSNTNQLDANTALVTGTYFVSRTQYGCESLRTPVVVTINSIPDAPTGVSPQVFIEGSTINDIVMNQSNVVWYISEQNAQNGINPLVQGMPLVNGTTYYGVIIGTNGCPSLPFALTVDVYLSDDKFVKEELKYYPNPVEDLLTISYSDHILQIEVFDLLGKRVKVKSTDDKEVNIDLSDLASGTYMVQLKTENKSQFLKIIKK